MAELRQRNGVSGRSQSAKLPAAAIAFLILTATISLIWSHYKLLWIDEFLELHTDSASSLQELVHIQRVWPVSIDPLAYHVLAHLAIRLLGAGAFAIRLPSLLGYLLMQICLFFFVRRIAGERAAVFALAFPALAPTLYYSAEGRPYGLFLGLCALAMASWQAATRRETKRTTALIALAVAIALVLNTCYFGVLLLFPLCAAECCRIFQRRRLDVPMLASIGSGMAGIAFTLPFLGAAAEYRLHYWDADAFNHRMMYQAYLTFLLGRAQGSLRFGRVVVIGLALVIVLVLWGCIRHLRSRPLLFAKAEGVFLVALAALPMFGYLLARFVTHSIELRHVIPALIGVAALLAIALWPLFRRERAGKLALIVLFGAITLAGVFRISAERISMRKTMSELTPAPEMKAALLANPGRLLYMQDTKHFESASYYEPNSEVRSRLALVYSEDREMLWCHHNTLALAAEHKRNFTRFNIVPFESIAAQPGDYIFVDYVDDKDSDLRSNWIDQAFLADHAVVRHIGPALGGDMVSVRFQP